MSFIVGSNFNYPASSLTMGAMAMKDDIIIAAMMAQNTVTHGTISVAGATVAGAALTEQSFITNATGSGGITILTGKVTAAGVPVLTGNALTDQGIGAWICRGLSSITKDSGSNSATGAANPLTATGAPSVLCSLFAIYLNEAAAAKFVSWNSQVTPDWVLPNLDPAWGHMCDVPTGSYAVGVNVVSDAGNMVAFIYLPSTGLSSNAISTFYPPL